MRKNIGFLLILGVSTLSLSGCLYRRITGPCYGVGCPTFSSSAQQKVAAVPQPADGNAQAQKSVAAGPAPAESSHAAPAQADASQGDAGKAKPGKLTRMLTAMHLHSKS